MKIKFIHILFFALFTSSSVNAQNYQVGKISAKRYEITNRLDNTKGKLEADKFLEPYKAKVDSFVGPIIGNSDQYMTSNRPESLLSNWGADVLFTESAKYDNSKKKVDFAVINIGGLRNVMPKGPVRLGDIYDITPFANYVTFLNLNGEGVLELFQQFGIFGGEGVSHGVKITFNKNHELVGATLNGKKINKKKIYRIATLDYLAEGNDNMKAFKKASDVNSTNVLVRDVYINYIKDQDKKGKNITSKLEGRTIILDK